VKVAYQGPFSSKPARRATHVFPREIQGSSAFLAEVEAGLEKIASLPALIVWGDRDVAFRDQERARFERLFANHRTVILHGAGHYIQEDASDEIVRAVLTWWDEKVADSLEASDGS
jgi:haloalkane dehalogenase